MIGDEAWLDLGVDERNEPFPDHSTTTTTAATIYGRHDNRQSTRRPFLSDRFQATPLPPTHPPPHLPLEIRGPPLVETFVPFHRIPFLFGKSFLPGFTGLIAFLFSMESECKMAPILGRLRSFTVFFQIPNWMARCDER